MRDELKTTRKKSETFTEPLFTNSENLRDGTYTGEVHILVEVVANPTSPNYGRREFRIHLTVTTGRHSGKTVLNSRVVLPHYLANMPPMGDQNKLKKWKGNIKNYLKQTDTILAKCGVDTSCSDKASLAEDIAKANRLKPIVKFKIRNGIPRIVSLIDYIVTLDTCSEDEPIPDGSDAPFGGENRHQ